MTTTFNPRQGLIIIPVEIFGPSGSSILRFAVDTGATYTIVSVAMLQAIGYQPELAQQRIPITTGSGQALAPRVMIERIDALEQTRSACHVLGHTLPSNVGIEGLLGLDFFRRQSLNIDFRNGKISLMKSN
jgi:predicted aspartyl protease